MLSNRNASIVPGRTLPNGRLWFLPCLNKTLSSPTMIWRLCSMARNRKSTSHRSGTNVNNSNSHRSYNVNNPLSIRAPSLSIADTLFLAGNVVSRGLQKSSRRLKPTKPSGLVNGLRRSITPPKVLKPSFRKPKSPRRSSTRSTSGGWDDFGPVVAVESGTTMRSSKPSAVQRPSRVSPVPVAALQQTPMGEILADRDRVTAASRVEADLYESLIDMDDRGPLDAPKKRSKPRNCKDRPDSRKARKGSGGSRAFVPWCKKT